MLTKCVAIFSARTQLAEHFLFPISRFLLTQFWGICNWRIVGTSGLLIDSWTFICHHWPSSKSLLLLSPSLTQLLLLIDSRKSNCHHSPISTITIIIMIIVDWFLDIQLSSSSSSMTFKHFIFFWKDILHREVLNTLWKFQMCVSQQIVSAYSTNTQKGSQFCCKNKSNNGRLLAVSSMYCFFGILRKWCKCNSKTSKLAQ